MARRKKKTHRSLAKRVKVTKTGKILGAKTGYHHKNVKKGSKRVRRARLGMQVKGRMRKRFLEMLSA